MVKGRASVCSVSVIGIIKISTSIIFKPMKSGVRRPQTARDCTVPSDRSLGAGESAGH